MIYDFPFIYPDELLYGVLGRYHKTDGNKNIKKVFEELFSKTTIVPIIDLPCHIDELCRNILVELGYSSDYLIQYCTLFPFYSPFMSVETRTKCISIIKNENGSGLKTKMGIIAGSICKKRDIYYCPECVQNELNNSINPYIHRLHQVEGVYICEKHKCKLKEYKESSSSRLQFINLDENNIDNEADFMENGNSILIGKYLRISEEVKYLLENDLSKALNQTIIYEKYYSLLAKRGYLTPAKQVKQSKLIKDFVEFYGDEFLKCLESKVETTDENSWLKIILRKPNRAIHPIRHILLIDFLAGSIEQYIEYREEIKTYPCLNKLCSCYKNSSKTEYTITADYKTREPVVTVKCSECGFKYSRKDSRDMYEIGAIKDFGSVWINRLKYILESSKDKSLRSVAREMDCDCKTIVKYAEKFGLRHLVKSTMRIKLAIKTEQNISKRGKSYKKVITEFINEYPNASIDDIKRNNYKEYMWLYKNDIQWLKGILPKRTKKITSASSKVDWNKRDKELLLMLRKEYEIIKKSKIPVRITKTLLGRRSGKLSYIEKKLDKLPLSRKYLETVQESVENFQIRRVESTLKELIEKCEPLVEWKVKKLAGLKSIVSSKVQDYINANIKKYFS